MYRVELVNNEQLHNTVTIAHVVIKLFWLPALQRQEQKDQMETFIC